ncbi:uncharacterized PE-PGRS family protein PE_PGRS46-like [Cyprinodon tularosa]|uniref:uncharacterized PE-PGRS family protein PE_PGRS46-like n=1 Tax=Cyprinodon tularosa TaxID=77115 RepID=UPI0018E28C76|nr:uncharacterized PE-PGRS family protein PE_PGRS46-like [Cyprinodon tularosa]
MSSPSSSFGTAALVQATGDGAAGSIAGYSEAAGTDTGNGTADVTPGFSRTSGGTVGCCDTGGVAAGLRWASGDGTGGLAAGLRWASGDGTGGLTGSAGTAASNTGR